MTWAQVCLLITYLIVIVNCDVKFDLSLLPHECLDAKAIAADYVPLGNMVTIGNITVYEYEHPDNVNTKRMLINVHDIYGLRYDNLKQVSDQMAIQSGGFKVVLPDFFRGDGWDTDRDPAERPEWSDRVTDWNRVVKPDLINLVNHYRSRGVEEFAIFGFCFGGKVSTLAAIELSDLFKASGLVHPSSVTDDEAYQVKIPMYLMPSMNEFNMTSFYGVLQSKFGDNCGHRRFDDMAHGFAGARGNYSDPIIRERVDEVITTLGVFFDRNLNETKANTSANLQPYSFLFMILIAYTLLTSRV